MESEPRSNFFPPPPAIRPWRAACRRSSLGRRRGSICWPPVGGPFVLCRGAEQRPSRLPPLLRIFRPPARELRPSATPAAEASQSRVEQQLSLVLPVAAPAAPVARPPSAPSIADPAVAAPLLVLCPFVRLRRPLRLRLVSTPSRMSRPPRRSESIADLVVAQSACGCSSGIGFGLLFCYVLCSAGWLSLCRFIYQAASATPFLAADLPANHLLRTCCCQFSLLLKIGVALVYYSAVLRPLVSSVHLHLSPPEIVIFCVCLLLSAATSIHSLLLLAAAYP